MFKKCMAAVALVGLLALAAAGQDAKTVITSATQAMGYDKLNTIEVLGSGLEGTGGLGQEESE